MSEKRCFICEDNDDESMQCEDCEMEEDEDEEILR